MIKRYAYDIEKYDFITLLNNLFDCKDLSSLHNKIPESHKIKELVNVDNDNTTYLHQIFYNKLNSGYDDFVDLYDKFIHDIVYCNIFNKCPIVYQKYPTFRIQLPNNLSVGGWHKDADYNHPEGEINFKVAFTDAYNTSAMWTETEPGKGDFIPLNMKPGEVVSFNGNQCIHGNKVNKTKKTRVDFDFRVIPYNLYNEKNYKTSISFGKKFIIGDYYKLMPEGI